MTVKNLSCDQLYQIWVSDPDWITVVDLRSLIEYESGHIPGAIHSNPESLEEFILKSSKQKPLVCISTDKQLEDKILEIQKKYEQVLMLKNCMDWPQKGFALTGQKPNQWMSSKEIHMNSSNIFVYQLFESQSSTYTYIIGDKVTQEMAIIDPVLETVDRDLKFIQDLDGNLLYVLDTHVHADHITGAGEIKKRVHAKTAVSKAAHVDCVDIPLEDGQELLLGDKKIKVISTPGHTSGCMSFYFEGKLFSGDALLIRSCGRTDFQQGSSETLYLSVTEKLFTLPDETEVYPGHDYRGFTRSTIGLEKALNSRLGRGIKKEEFVRIMSELKLAHPKKIQEALPANMACGAPKDMRVLHPQISDGIPEVSVFQVNEAKQNVLLLDVRRPDEFNAEYGHIEGAKLVTLGAELTEYLARGDKSNEIVFVCRSGGRSGQATSQALQLGYSKVANMVGGMITWNLQKLPIVRDGAN